MPQNSKKSPTHIVMCPLGDLDELARIALEDPAALKARADAAADASKTTVLHIWITESERFPLIAVVNARSKTKATAFLAAFGITSAQSPAVVAIDRKASKSLAEALAHTKMMAPPG